MRDKPWLMRTYSGHSSRARPTSSTAPTWPRARPACRSRSTCPPRPGTTPTTRSPAGEVGKVGVPVPHLGDMRTLFEGIPLDEMNTSMTINATAMWLFGMYLALAEERGVDPARLAGTTQNDIVKEYLSPRHLHLRPRAVAPAHRRPRVPRGAARAEVEPDQRLLVPPAGGRRDAGRGGRVRARHRDRRARRGARVGPGERRRVPRGRRAHLVLRERGHPLRRGDVQAARVRRAVGPHHRRALRRDRRQAPPLPLRRAGELARPHRGAAREQRAAHRARDARRHAVEGRARPGRAAAGVERGARAAAARGTSSGRCASSRCSRSRPTCSSTTTCSPGRTSSRPRPPSWRRRRRPSCSGCSTAAARSP